MVNNTAHIQYEEGVHQETPVGSADWAFDDGTRSVPGLRLGAIRRRPPPLARWGLVFTVISSLSPCPDPWLEAQKQRGQLTMASAFQPYTSRRRITLLEARKMALEILYRAEDGRVKAAQAEAERGINWEETT